MAKNYYISFDNVSWTEFYPSNDPVIAFERSDEIYLRYSVDSFKIARHVGSISWIVDSNGDYVLDVNGDKISAAGNEYVFDIIFTMFFDSDTFGDPLYFKVAKGGVDTYFFKSSVNESRLDSQNAVFEISPSADDTYQDVLDNYETEYRVNPAGTTLYIPELNTAAFVNVDFDTFTDPGGTVTWDQTLVVQTATNTIDNVQSANRRLLVYIENFVGSDFVLELINQVGATISNVETITGDGTYEFIQNAGATTLKLQMSSELVPASSGSYDYEIYWSKASLGRGQSLEAYITQFLSSTYMNAGVDYVSTYLDQDALGSDPPEPIDTFMTAWPNGNYAGNLQGFRIDNPWNDMFIGRIDSFTGDNVGIPQLSFKDLNMMLKEKLRAWWHIDEDDKFRLEHEEYYRSHLPQIDLTTPIYSSYKPETDVSLYTYDKGGIVSSIAYAENNAVNEDFVAFPVNYDVLKTTPKSIEVNTDISTDIQNILDNAATISPDGLYLAKCTLVGGVNYHLDFDIGQISGDDKILNAKLAYSYLQRYFWTYFQEGSPLDINDGTSVDALAVKEFLKQDDIGFFFEGELNWIKPVTLSNGTAWLEKISESDSEFITLNVGFDPYL